MTMSSLPRPPSRPRRCPLRHPRPTRPFALARCRADASFPISNAASASTPPRSAPRWTPPSAVPTPRALGTGRPPMTPARRRPCCSCASSGPAMRARAASPAAIAADAGQDRGPSPHPHAPLRGEPGASAILDADRARLRGERRRRDHARRSRAGALGRNRTARHLRRARGGVARSQRTGRDPRRRCWTISSPASPSPASTPRRSTIISTPASRRASC